IRAPVKPVPTNESLRFLTFAVIIGVASRPGNASGTNGGIGPIGGGRAVAGLHREEGLRRLRKRQAQGGACRNGVGRRPPGPARDPAADEWRFSEWRRG